MYKKKIPTATTMVINEAIEGETIENKMRRVTQNKEPITDGAPTLYTERKDGVKPEYNPRTDTFELAIEATDKGSKAALAKRKAAMAEKEEAEKPKETNPEGLTKGEKTGDQSQ